MKRILIWSAAVVLCAGAVAAQTGGSPSPRTTTATPPARAASPLVPEDEPPAELLRAMRQRFHPDVAPYLGVQSPADLDHVEVGRVIRTYQVDHKQLQTYDGKSPALAMLNEAPAVTRLISVRGNVVSSIVLRNVGSSWKVTRIEKARRAIAIDRIITALATRGVATRSTFLVEVPALNLEFVGHAEGPSVELAPLWDVPHLGLVAGNVQPGERALASLVAAAQEVPTR